MAGWFGPSNCSGCGDTFKKCDSRDCSLYTPLGEDGPPKCTNKEVTEAIQDEEGIWPSKHKKRIQRGQKAYYWGASMCYPNGDWMRYGDEVEVIQLGKGKPDDGKTPPSEENDFYQNNKPWVLVLKPGNMQYTEVKLLNSSPPRPGKDIEPSSKVARLANMKCKFNAAGDTKAFQTPCDIHGRILTSEDGTYCGQNQVCVTSLPHDFAKDLPPMPSPESGDCWMQFTPECTNQECPPPPYCHPEPPQRPGHKHEVPSFCPPPKKCTVKPCQPPYMKDMCKAAAGQPWCVSPQALSTYKGPIEINCSASGKNIKQNKHGPDQCHWLLNNTRDFLQRLPGKIKKPYADPSDNKFFSKTEGMSEKEAATWINEGTLPAATINDNNEFLARKPAVA